MRWKIANDLRHNLPPTSSELFVCLVDQLWYFENRIENDVISNDPRWISARKLYAINISKYIWKWKIFKVVCDLCLNKLQAQNTIQEPFLFLFLYNFMSWLHANNVRWHIQIKCWLFCFVAEILTIPWIVLNGAEESERKANDQKKKEHKNNEIKKKKTHYRKKDRVRLKFQ